MKYNKLTQMGVVGEDRQCGRTLGLAFHYIGKALSNPNVSLSIHDHHHHHEANMQLAYTIQQVIDICELKLITVMGPPYTLRYDLYTEVKAPERIIKDGRMLTRQGNVENFYDGHYYS